MFGIHYGLCFFFSGNGYIEGTELDNFLREFIASVNNVDTGPEVRSTCCSCRTVMFFSDLLLFKHLAQ